MRWRVNSGTLVSRSFITLTLFRNEALLGLWGDFSLVSELGQTTIARCVYPV
jgi:hypothetical protein